MLDLALNSGKGPISLKDISKRQEISEKYLWHLIPPLKNAGLVTATRGPHGGYILAKPLRQISLKDIVSVLEGPMCLVDCASDPVCCKRSPNCITRDVWAEATAKILQTLESFSLEDMVEKQKKKQKNSSYEI